MKKLQITNKTLIEECRKGDKEALNLFYLRFAPRMLSVIHRYIRDQENAEDILHDGFIIGLTRLDNLRDADKVEVWLATIMKNLSLRFLQEQDMSLILHEIPEVDDTPEIEEILDLDTLETLIAKLPSGYQKVFRLAILENKSHKEIGKLLGIAPNSSSSQLFHAKLMMRKLINEYKVQTGLVTLLIAVLIIGLIILNRHSSLPDSQDTLIAEIIDDSIIISTDSALASTAEPMTIADARTAVMENKKNTWEDITQPENLPDTLHTAADTVKTPAERPKERKDSYYADATGNNSPGDHNIRRTKASGWSLNIGANPGLLNHISSSSSDNLFSSPVDGSIGSEKPGSDDNAGKNDRLWQKPAELNDFRNMPHTNSLPISVALTVSKKLNSTFSIETGARYTYLHSKFETSSSFADCHWHYIGIPVKINVMICSSNIFVFYAGAGGSVDIPLYSSSEVTSDNALSYLKTGRFSSPAVWSLSGNLGVAVKLSRKIDLFLEPTMQYHFEHKYTVPNTWTDNKWNFSIPFGIRLNF